MSRYPALALAGLLGLALSAQQATPPFPCLTDDATVLEPLHGNDPETLARIEATRLELEAFTAEFAASGAEHQRATHIIPVVFHIIHDNGPENISDAQVYDAMEILNEDFSRSNPDWSTVNPAFLGIVADVDVEFRLAKKDPSGNCTKGITRTQSALTHQGDQAMKNLIQWPRNRYMNVWVCAYADGAAGYTLTPANAHWLAPADGIVMKHDYVGSIGTGNNSGSRTLTHEVGHWINLAHTWGPTNDPGLASNCNTDDGVSDTPNTIGWTNCNVNGSTCNSLDNVENYMEYSFCSKMFTNGQKTRMIAALNSSTAQRNQLSQSQNLTFTGVNGPDVLCAAEFMPGPQIICAGGSISFTDQSFHNVVSRTWTFPGGTPASSTAMNPTVTYNTAGVYDVTLTASDGNGQVSTTVAGHVTVLAVPGTSVPFHEGFESYEDLDNSPWFVVNPNNNNTWTVNTAAATNGSKSVRILNTFNMGGQVDEMISGTYDMSGATQAVITFRYAYAQRTASSNDRLRVWVSNNCGNSWSPRLSLTGTQALNTVGAPQSATFVPNANQWGYSEVTNIPATFHTGNFRVKFEFLSDGGNNIYLDDININNQPVSVEELVGDGPGLLVVPNPTAGQAQAIFQLGAAAQTTLEMIDVLGRTVATPIAGMLTAGEHRVDLPVQGMVSGIYFLRLRQDGREQVTRFVVE